VAAARPGPRGVVSLNGPAACGRIHSGRPLWGEQIVFTASCQGCKKRYRLREQLAGSLPPCPHCGATLEVEPLPELKPLRQRLQEDLQRVASAERAPAPSSQGPKVRVAERAGWGRGLIRFLLIGLAAAVVIGGAGLGVRHYLTSHRSAPRPLPQDVQDAIARAQHADVPGHEADALAAWQVVRRQIAAYRRSPEEFQAELARCEQRIREIEDILRQRREALTPAAPPAGQPKPTEAPPAAARPAAPAPAAATQPPAVRPDLRAVANAVQQSSARGDPVVVVDGPDRYQRWHGEAWADPVGLRLDQAASTGEQWVALTQMDGGAGKWVASIDQPLDVTACDSLTLEMQTAEPVSLALGVWTRPGPALFEGKTQTAQKGDRVAVTFPLKGNGFKSEQTRWQFGAAIANPANVTSLSLFIYSRSNSPIRFRNVALRKAEASPPSPPSR
jgi:hypothetical protein